MTDDEWAVHKAFYDLTVKERDAAWVESAHLRAEVGLLHDALRLMHDDVARAKDEGRDEAWEELRAEVEYLRGERADVVAWLRECAYGHDGLGSRNTGNLLRTLSTNIERGEHRREEER